MVPAGLAIRVSGAVGARMSVSQSSVRGDANRIDFPDGRIVLVRFGPASSDTGALIRWIDGGCQMEGAPRRGFLAIDIAPQSNTVRAIVGARPNLSLFYTAEADSVIMGEHPRDVIARMLAAPELDSALLAALAIGRAPSDRTPFASIRLLLRGQILTWRPGESTTVESWFAPPKLEPLHLPTPESEARAMREAVTSAVALSLPPCEDVGLYLSGGLDSSMIAACAAPIQASRGQAIRAFVHRPLAADRGVLGRPLAGDSRWAQTVTRRLPATSLEVVVNTRRLLPLDLLADTFNRTWLPLTGFNSVWVNEVAARGRSQGLPVLLHGGSGNDTFSMPPYKVTEDDILRLPRLERAAYRAEMRRQSAAARLRRATGGGPQRLGYRRDQARMLLNPAYLPSDHGEIVHYTQVSDPRQAWFFRLKRHHLGNIASGLYSAPVYRDDVLADPEVIRVAVSLSPESWIRHGMSRSVARRAARSRLPLSVRLRVVRGQQSGDSGLLMRGRLPSWLEAAETIAGSPVASDLVDVHAFQEGLSTWDDENPTHLASLGSTYLPVVTVGLFAAWWESQRAQTDPSWWGDEFGGHPTTTPIREL